MRQHNLLHGVKEEIVSQTIKSLSLPLPVSYLLRLDVRSFIRRYKDPILPVCDMNQVYRVQLYLLKKSYPGHDFWIRYTTWCWDYLHLTLMLASLTSSFYCEPDWLESKMSLLSPTPMWRSQPGPIKNRFIFTWYTVTNVIMQDQWYRKHSAVRRGANTCSIEMWYFFVSVLESIHKHFFSVTVRYKSRISNSLQTINKLGM